MDTILMKLLQKTPKCVLKFCLEAMKVLLVCVFLILRTRLFCQHHFHSKFRAIFDFKHFFENL